MRALRAALDSRPPHWIVGRAQPRMTAGKTAGVARLQWPVIENETRRTATGFDSPHSTNILLIKK
nr:MAG TPA: hypothetical protein [Caudoviricetes sp.]